MLGFRFLAGFVLLLVAAGCSGKDQPVRQKGIVTLEGKPLAGLMVTFMSTDNQRPASGLTDEAGRFELMTLNPGDGALRGEYKVVLSSATPEPQEPPPGMPPPPPLKDSEMKKVPAIHPNYQNALTTPLLRVIPAPEGTITLELNKEGT